METITIALAGEPRGKGRPQFSTRGGFPRAITPERTRTYEAALRYAAQETMAGRPPLDGPLKVEVFAWFAIPPSWSKKKRQAALAGAVRPTGKPDWENIAKVLDAFNGVVWRDDSLVVEGHIRKGYVLEGPSLIVHVEPLGQGA